MFFVLILGKNKNVRSKKVWELSLNQVKIEHEAVRVSMSGLCCGISFQFPLRLTSRSHGITVWRHDAIRAFPGMRVRWRHSADRLMDSRSPAGESQGIIVTLGDVTLPPLKRIIIEITPYYNALWSKADLNACLYGASHCMKINWFRGWDLWGSHVWVF